MNLQLDPAVAVLITACGVLLFLSAAVHKFRDVGRFRQILAAYALLPKLAQGPAAALIPVLEAAVALGLLFPGARAAAAAVGVVLLSGYAGAIAVNLFRGRRDLTCGCGGSEDGRPIAGWMVWRNLVLAALLGASLLPSSTRPLEATDVLTVGFGSVTCALLYLCLDRLLGTTGPLAPRRY